MTASLSPRILLVTPGFPADEQDSLCIPPAQLMLVEIMARYPKLEISVLALHYPSEKRNYRWNGIEVRALGRANHRWPFRLIDLARARRVACSLHEDRPFTHIHALWLTDAALVASSLAHSWSCSSSVTAMGQDVLPTNLYLRRLSKFPTQRVAISDRAGKTLEQSIDSAIDAVVPWGIQPPPEGLATWENRAIDLLGVGSLIDLKGWSMLLEVIQKLAKKGDLRRTVLVGDGPLMAELQEEANQRGIFENIVFTGELPRSEVLRLMENARILVHPSRFEGQGFVFTEALSRGMSIVSGPVGSAFASPRWRVTDPSGFGAACSGLLRHPPPTEGLVLNRLQDTVTAYADLWGIDR